MYLYEITNTVTPDVYVGITRRSVRARWVAHKSAAKKYNWPLYSAMNKYGVDNFKLTIIGNFLTEAELLEAEKERVAFHRTHDRCLNVLDGGEFYFPIKDKEAWKDKLKEKRVGRTPALGMKHSEENKKIFSECSKKRWDIYGRYPDLSDLSFSEAHKKYGISKTHYYRKRNMGSDHV